MLSLVCCFCVCLHVFTNMLFPPPPLSVSQTERRRFIARRSPPSSSSSSLCSRHLTQPVTFGLQRRCPLTFTETEKLLPSDRRQNVKNKHKKPLAVFKKSVFHFSFFLCFICISSLFFSFFFFFFIFFKLTNNPPSLDRRCQRALLPRPLSETVGLVLIQQTEGELWLRGVLASAQSLFIRWFCFSI